MISIHIVIALVSLVISFLGVVRPARSIIRSAYALIALTTLTGIMLVIEGYSIMHVCAMSTVYLAVAIGMNLLATRKLASV